MLNSYEFTILPNTKILCLFILFVLNSYKFTVFIISIYYRIYEFTVLPKAYLLYIL
jgi:hypothetical protein